MDNPRIAVLISAWNEAPLLPDCITSAKQIDPALVLVADGAYETYLAAAPLPKLVDWDWVSTDGSANVAIRAGAYWKHSPTRPYATEAAKKTAMLDEVRSLADYALFLDADERLEYDPRFDLGRQLVGSRAGVISRYREDGQREGSLTRVLKLTPDLHFRPPMDFDVYDGDTKVSILDGETPTVPTSYITAVDITHHRLLRSKERHDTTGRYCVQRREAHGVG